MSKVEHYPVDDGFFCVCGDPDCELDALFHDPEALAGSADDLFWAHTSDWAEEIKADYAACPEVFVNPADLVWDDFDSEVMA